MMMSTKTTAAGESLAGATTMLPLDANFTPPVDTTMSLCCPQPMAPLLLDTDDTASSTEAFVSNNSFTVAAAALTKAYTVAAPKIQAQLKAVAPTGAALVAVSKASSVVVAAAKAAPAKCAAAVAAKTYYPREFAASAPDAAAIFVAILSVMSWCSPVGLAFWILSAVNGSGFKTQLAATDELSAPVRPTKHNPNATKIEVPFKATRVGTNTNFPTQSFSRSLLWTLVLNRFKIADAVGLVLACVFVWYAPDTLLDTTSVRLTVDLFLGNFMTYVWLNTVHWIDSARPLANATHADARARKTPFLLSVVKLVRNVWVPEASFISEEVATTRGLCTVGLEYWVYLLDLLTWAVEYKVQAVFRFLCFDLGCAPGPAMTSENIYQSIINTSLCCWFNAATSRVEFHDVLMPQDSTDVKLWAAITLELDPTTRTVGTLRLEPYNKGGKNVEVITTTNLAEISAVIHIILCFKTHPAVHFWANSIEGVTEAEWPLATMAHNHTQGFNNGAVFSTAEMMGHTTSAQFMGVCASHGARAGIPIHGQALAEIATHSVAHQMTRACRAALTKIRPSQQAVESDIAMPKMKREAIIQSTVMHAIDHHYNAKYLPACANSEILNTSTQMVLILTRPFDYKCRSVMMKHHVATDEVSKALYNACAQYDRHFADKSLTIGVLV